jgi:hypothetical protein
MRKLLSKLAEIRCKSSEAVLRAAACVVADCWRRDMEAEVLDLLPIRGGIWVLFWNGSAYADLELKNSGKISLMFSKEQDGGAVLLSSANPKTPRQAVEMVWEFLGHKTEKALDTGAVRV